MSRPGARPRPGGGEPPTLGESVNPPRRGSRLRLPETPTSGFQGCRPRAGRFPVLPGTKRRLVILANVACTGRLIYRTDILPEPGRRAGGRRSQVIAKFGRLLRGGADLPGSGDRMGTAVRVADLRGLGVRPRGSACWSTSDKTVPAGGSEVLGRPARTAGGRVPAHLPPPPGRLSSNVCSL